MTQEIHPPKLDIKHAAQSAAQFSGRDLLSNYERLTHEAQGLGNENYLNWSARTELSQDGAGLEQVGLHLVVDVTLPQICQRCLTQVEVAVHIDRTFRFVESEAVAAELDDGSEDDVLVLSREFDLAALIEDEVLMDLPLVARHDICPVEVKLAVADANFIDTAPPPSPFAVLTKLKGQVG
jgi:uncharacterized protein